MRKHRPLALAGLSPDTLHWRHAVKLFDSEKCSIRPAPSPPPSGRPRTFEDTPFQSAVVCACGYRSETDKVASLALAKVRYIATEVMEHR